MSPHRPRRRRIASLALSLAALGGLAANAHAASRGVSLRVDANRDGSLTAADDTGAAVASVRRGALVLPNIDDDGRRCARTVAGLIRRHEALTAPAKGDDDAVLVRRARRAALVTRMHACNDAGDEVVNGPRDLRNLAPVELAPVASASPRATGTVGLDRHSAPHARLFFHRGGRWTAVRGEARLRAGELRRGLRMAVEAREVHTGAGWDGVVTVRARVADGAHASADVARLRVAPVITMNHLMPVRSIVVSPNADRPHGRVPGAAGPVGAPPPKADPATARRHRRNAEEVVSRLRAVARQRGLPDGVRVLTAEDIWAQDYMEPLYAAVPGPGGTPHTMTVLMRSDQQRPGSLAPFRLLGPGVGVMRAAARTAPGTSANSTGNLETIPPYAHGGRAFPAGRVVVGSQSALDRPSASVLRMFRAQGLQDPIVLDTSRLGVGHVDEFIQFLPAPGTPRGWRVAVADPVGAVGLLERVKAAGGGAQPVMRYTAPAGTDAAPEDRPQSVDAVLADPHTRPDAEFAAGRIARNLDVIRRETGITDADVVRVPVLFRGEQMMSAAEIANTAKQIRKDKAFAHLPANLRAEALLGTRQASAQRRANPYGRQVTNGLPDAINSVVLTPGAVLVPQQFGPTVDGVDVFQKAVDDAYASAGLTAVPIDDVQLFHNGGGEIRCGTNTLRLPTEAWWRSAPAGG